MKTFSSHSCVMQVLMRKGYPLDHPAVNVVHERVARSQHSVPVHSGILPHVPLALRQKPTALTLRIPGLQCTLE